MILLDTHVALWLAGAPQRLGPRTSRLCQDDEVAVSAISALEVAIKRMSGRLDPALRLVSGPGVVAAPFTALHASAVPLLSELNGTDPFDRALAGRALAEGARFMTADRRLLGPGHDWILDAAA